MTRLNYNRATHAIKEIQVLEIVKKLPFIRDDNIILTKLDKEIERMKREFEKL